VGISIINPGSRYTLWSMFALLFSGLVVSFYAFFITGSEAWNEENKTQNVDRIDELRIILSEFNLNSSSGIRWLMKSCRKRIDHNNKIMSTANFDRLLIAVLCAVISSSFIASFVDYSLGSFGIAETLNLVALIGGILIIVFLAYLAIRSFWKEISTVDKYVYETLLDDLCYIKSQINEQS